MISAKTCSWPKFHGCAQQCKCRLMVFDCARRRDLPVLLVSFSLSQAEQKIVLWRQLTACLIHWKTVMMSWVETPYKVQKIKKTSSQEVPLALRAWRYELTYRADLWIMEPANSAATHNRQNFRLTSTLKLQIIQPCTAPCIKLMQICTMKRPAVPFALEIGAHLMHSQWLRSWQEAPSTQHTKDASIWETLQISPNRRPSCIMACAELIMTWLKFAVQQYETHLSWLLGTTVKNTAFLRHEKFERKVWSPDLADQNRGANESETSYENTCFQ